MAAAGQIYMNIIKGVAVRKKCYFFNELREVSLQNNREVNILVLYFFHHLKSYNLWEGGSQGEK